MVGLWNRKCALSFTAVMCELLLCTGAIAGPTDSAGESVKPNVRDLLSLLAVPERRAEALAGFDKLGLRALEELVGAYWQDEKLRQAAFEVLVRIAGNYPQGSSAAVPVFISAVESEDQWVAMHAAQCLGIIGFDARSAVGPLTDALGRPEVQRFSLRALSSIAESLHDNARRMRFEEMREAVGLLTKSHEMAASIFQDDPSNRPYVDRLRRSEEYLVLVLKDRENSPIHALGEILKAHPVPVVILAVLLILEVLSVLLFFFYPAGLPTWSNWVRSSFIPETVSKWLPAGPILAKILFTEFWAGRPSVLRTWVERHRGQVERSTSLLAEAKNHAIRVPLPIVFDNELLEDLDADKLHKVFERSCMCILIQGEGGTGKTNLAFELARRSMKESSAGRLCRQQMMLPVVLTEELLKGAHDAASCGQHLLDAIGGQLKYLAQCKKPIGEHFLKELLIQRHILVIIDDISEASPWPKVIAQSGCPANAIILTSRSNRILRGTPRVVLEPERLRGERILDFVESYIERLGQAWRFEPGELRRLCGNLTTLARGGSVTVCLPRIYAELVLHRKRENQNLTLPSCIPELMVRYLEFLNRNPLDGMPTNDVVYEAAKTLAWVSIRQYFLPSALTHAVATAALGSDAASAGCLEHLVLLGLVRHEKGHPDLLRFSLDPLAEYLAGLWLVTNYRDNEMPWQEFMHTAQGKYALTKEVGGFLCAVLDCCTTYCQEFRISDSIIRGLRDLLGRQASCSAEG